MRVRFSLIAFLACVAAPPATNSLSLSQQSVATDFQDGCCIDTAFPLPRNVSQATVSRRVLLEAVKCATNNPLKDGTAHTANGLANRKDLTVSYYFGVYMPQQEADALTIAVYSADGKTGWLFDMERKGHKYYLANMPELLKSGNHWRVGEINGGQWSYTRLWYLAQEIGSRPRQELPIRTVRRARPESCQISHPVWPTKSAR